jgi:hypothetical protein
MTELVLETTFEDKANTANLLPLTNEKSKKNNNKINLDEKIGD